MKAVLETLAANLERVRAELELYAVLADALESRFRADRKALQEFNRRARRVTYSNTIVGCYGLIEQTVDSVLVSVAEAYGRVYECYGDLPDGVRSNHRDLLLQCLRDGEKARTRHKIDERSAIDALGRYPDQPAGLLATVFTLSTANYRQPHVQMLFNRLGVDIAAGLSQNEPQDDLDKVGFASYESFLEDLVQRRNDLAHSYGDDNIVDPDLLNAYIEIVGDYLVSIIRVANRYILNLLTKIKLEPIGTVVKTWTGRIGIAMNAGSLRVSDRILLTKEEWSTSHMVTSIQVDSQRFDSVEFSGETLNVSAQVDCVPQNSENSIAYVISNEWREFWPSADKWLRSKDLRLNQ